MGGNLKANGGDRDPRIHGLWEMGIISQLLLLHHITTMRSRFPFDLKLEFKLEVVVANTEALNCSFLWYVYSAPLHIYDHASEAYSVDVLPVLGLEDN